MDTQPDWAETRYTNLFYEVKAYRLHNSDELHGTLLGLKPVYRSTGVVPSLAELFCRHDTRLSCIRKKSDVNCCIYWTAKECLQMCTEVFQMYRKLNKYGELQLHILKRLPVIPELLYLNTDWWYRLLVHSNAPTKIAVGYQFSWNQTVWAIHCSYRMKRLSLRHSIGYILKLHLSLTFQFMSKDICK